MSFGKDETDLEGVLPSTRISIPMNQYTLPQYGLNNPTPLPPPMSASKPRTSHVDDNDSDDDTPGFRKETPAAPRKAPRPQGQATSGTYGVPFPPPIQPNLIPYRIFRKDKL